MSYIKNLAKSFRYAIPAVGASLLPSVSKTYRENANFTSDVLRGAKNFSRTSSFMNLITEHETVKDIKGGLKTAMSDLKSGNLHSGGKREEAAFMKEFGFDGMDDFNLDDAEITKDSSSDSSSFTKNNFTGVRQNVTNVTNVIGGTPGKAYQKTMRGFASITAAIGTKQLEMMNHQLIALNKLVEFNAHQTQAFYEQSMTYYTESSRQMTELVNIMSAMGTHSGALGKNNLASSIFGNKPPIDREGVFSLQAYSKVVKDNIRSLFDEKDPSGGMFKSMMKAAIADPVGKALEFAIIKTMPKVFKESLSKLNDVIAGIPAMFVLTMNKWAKDPKSGFKKFVGRIFGIDMESKVDLGGFEKGPIPFDGITKRAITHVIPTLLGQILQAIKGGKMKDTRVYDNTTGKWTTAGERVSAFGQMQKDAMSKNFDNIRAEMMKSVKDMNQQMSKAAEKALEKNLNNAFVAIAKKGQKYDGRGSAKDFGADPNAMNMINQWMKQTRGGTKFNAALYQAMVARQGIMRDVAGNADDGIQLALSLMDPSNMKRMPANVRRMMGQGPIKSGQNQLKGMNLSGTQFQSEADRALKEIQTATNKPGFLNKLKRIYQKPFEIAAKGINWFSDKLNNLFFGDGTDGKMKGLFTSLKEKFMNGVVTPIKKIMFGEKDPEGRKIKEGLVDQVKKKIDEAIIQPVKNYFNTMIFPYFKRAKDAVAVFLFGEKGDDGMRKGGIFGKMVNGFNTLVDRTREYLFGKDGKAGAITPEMRAKLAKYGKGALVGGALSIFLPGGPLMMAGLGMLHQTEAAQKWLYDPKTGVVTKARDGIKKIGKRVGTYLFGEKGEDGLYTKVGKLTHITNILKTHVEDVKLKMNKFFFGNSEAEDGTFKNKGLFKWVKDETVKAYHKIAGKLFGEKGEDGRRSGGLLGDFIQLGKDKIIQPLKETIIKDWNRVTKFFNEKVIQPLKDSLDPFVKEFRYQLKRLGEWSKEVFSSGLKKFKDAMDSIFKNTFGKPLTQMMEEYVIDPLKKTLTSIKEMIGGIFKKILLFPVNLIKQAADNLREKQAARGDAMAPTEKEIAKKKAFDERVAQKNADSLKAKNDRILKEREQKAMSGKTQVVNSVTAGEARIGTAIHDVGDRVREAIVDVGKDIKRLIDTVRNRAGRKKKGTSAPGEVPSEGGVVGGGGSPANGGFKPRHKLNLQMFAASPEEEEGGQAKSSVLSSGGEVNLTQTNKILMNIDRTTRQILAILKNGFGGKGGKGGPGGGKGGFFGKLWSFITSPIAFMKNLLGRVVGVIMAPFRMIGKAVGQVIGGLIKLPLTLANAFAKSAGKIAEASVKAIGGLIKTTGAIIQGAFKLVGSLADTAVRLVDVGVNAADKLIRGAFAIGSALGKATFAVAKFGFEITGTLLKGVMQLGSVIGQATLGIAKFVGSLLWGVAQFTGRAALGTLRLGGKLVGGMFGGLFGGGSATKAAKARIQDVRIVGQTKTVVVTMGASSSPVDPRGIVKPNSNAPLRHKLNLQMFAAPQVDEDMANSWKGALSKIKRKEGEKQKAAFDSSLLKSNKDTAFHVGELNTRGKRFWGLFSMILPAIMTGLGAVWTFFTKGGFIRAIGSLFKLENWAKWLRPITTAIKWLAGVITGRNFLDRAGDIDIDGPDGDKKGKKGKKGKTKRVRTRGRGKLGALKSIFSRGGGAVAEEIAEDTSDIVRKNRARTAELREKWGGSKPTSRLSGLSRAEGEIAENVAKKGGKKAVEKAATKGLLKAGGKLALRGGLNAAKAIPVAGQVLAVGMAAYDAVDGWNKAGDYFGTDDPTFGQKLSSSIGNLVTMGMAGESAAKWINKAGSWVGDKWNSFAKSVGSFWGGTKKVAAAAWDKTKEFAGKAWDKATEVGGKVWDGIKGFGKNMWEKAKGNAKATWDFFSQGVPGMFEDIKTGAANFWNKAQDFAKDAWGGIKSAGSKAWGGIKDFFGYGDKSDSSSDSSSGGGGFDLMGLWNKAKNGVTNGLNKAGDWLQKNGVLDTIKSATTLGALSAKYESSGNAGTVAHTKGDIGGASYGTYQFATNGGLDGFVKSLATSNPEMYAQLKGKKYGSSEFDAAWKNIAAQNNAGFAQVQHDYIKNNYFAPSVTKVANATGLDVTTRSKAVQDVLWSTAVQHGDAAKIFKNAGVTNKMTDEQIINAVYDARAKSIMASKNSDSVKKGVLSRYENEKADALNMLKNGIGTGVGGNTVIGGGGDSSTGQAAAVVAKAKQYIGKVKYVFGADNIDGGQGDCSSFTQHVFKKAVGIDIGRTTGQQVDVGNQVDPSQVVAGDLVFFKDTYKSGNKYGVSHVGIALGDGTMVHNASKGVEVSSYTNGYWKDHFLMVRRVVSGGATGMPSTMSGDSASDAPDDEAAAKKALINKYDQATFGTVGGLKEKVWNQAQGTSLSDYKNGDLGKVANNTATAKTLDPNKGNSYQNAAAGVSQFAFDVHNTQRIDTALGSTVDFGNVGLNAADATKFLKADPFDDARTRLNASDATKFLKDDPFDDWRSRLNASDASKFLKNDPFDDWKSRLNASDATKFLAKDPEDDASKRLNAAGIVKRSKLTVDELVKLGFWKDLAKDLQGKSDHYVKQELGRAQYAWDEYGVVKRPDLQQKAASYADALRKFAKVSEFDITVPNGDYKKFYPKEKTVPAGWYLEPEHLKILGYTTNIPKLAQDIAGDELPPKVTVDPKKDEAGLNKSTISITENGKTNALNATSAPLITGGADVSSNGSTATASGTNTPSAAAAKSSATASKSTAVQTTAASMAEKTATLATASSAAKEMKTDHDYFEKMVALLTDISESNKKIADKEPTININGSKVEPKAAGKDASKSAKSGDTEVHVDPKGMVNIFTPMMNAIRAASGPDSGSGASGLPHTIQKIAGGV